ncbi:MAG: hypothetical protein K2X47_02175, partial [Bdellovibrionales bacterium]|nr:hypothetical protein [Bdellovibrionales bacterium]
MNVKLWAFLLFAISAVIAPVIQAGPGGPRERIRISKEISPRSWESIVRDLEKGNYTSSEGKATWSFAKALGIDRSTPAGKEEWKSLQKQLQSFD